MMLFVQEKRQFRYCFFFTMVSCSLRSFKPRRLSYSSLIYTAYILKLSISQIRGSISLIYVPNIASISSTRALNFHVAFASNIFSDALVQISHLYSIIGSNSLLFCCFINSLAKLLASLTNSKLSIIQQIFERMQQNS